MREQTKREVDELNRQLQAAEQIYIYGAQIVAYDIFLALTECFGCEVGGFLVTEFSGNPRKLAGRPVQRLADVWLPEPGTLIVVATPEIYHEDILKALTEKGIRRVLCVNTHVEYLLMSAYFRKFGRFKILEDLPWMGCADKNYERSDKLVMYMAKHHRDGALKRQYELPQWIKPIQVGSSQTDCILAGLQDHVGDNISGKNCNYSEMTAMYWVWKHSDAAYKGVCHYRRILHLSEPDLEMIVQQRINVVLPFPYVCTPDTAGQYRRYIGAADEQALFQVLAELEPEYAAAAERLLQEPYLYNYNMFLADAKTFDEYCNWIFPLLKRLEEVCGDETVRCDRYIGYLSEVLTSLYFLYNKNSLKIMHAEKVWMV